MESKNLTQETDKVVEERKKLFMDSKFQPNNQKYGLFSYTGTLSISDSPYYLKSQSHRGPDGNVITGPRNFLSSPTKPGKTTDVYFSLPNYTADPFKDPSKPYLKEKFLAQKMKEKHSSAWKPGGNKPEMYSLFPHEPTEIFKKINKRDSDGKVITGPRNFYTSPPKKGIASITPGLLLGPSQEYISDPYDRKHKLWSEDNTKHKAKMQAQSFKSMDPGGKLFSDFKSTYNGEIPEAKTNRAQVSPIELKHPQPFYPPNSRNHDTFGEYPKHMPEAYTSLSKSPSLDKPAWRSSTGLRTIPSPSISNSIKNLRTEFPLLRKIS